MNWKKIFVDKRKIILTIIFLIMVVYIHFNPEFQRTYLNPWLISGIILGFLIYGPAIFLNLIGIETLANLSWLWILVILYWFVISSVVIFIYDKLKGRKK